MVLLRKRLGAWRADAREMGWSYGWSRLQDYLQGYRYVYDDRLDREAIRQTIHQFPAHPVISILLPVHAGDAGWLKRAVRSVQDQLYPAWQLCIVDDCSPSDEVRTFVEGLNDKRVRFERLETNLGISGATERARGLATGEYITLLDHDDELTPDALFEAVKAIMVHDPDVLYADEDTVTCEGRFLHGHFKPDFSPELLLSHNYITHPLFARASLIEQVGGLRPEFDGAQDYDLALRLTEAAKRIGHLRKVLYHWRYVPTSVSRRAAGAAQTDDAGRRAVEEALKRRGQAATVDGAGLPNHYQVRYDVENTPLMSVIVLSSATRRECEACLRAARDSVAYANVEYIVIAPSDGEAPPEDVRVCAVSATDSPASAINQAVAMAKGDYLALTAASVHLRTKGWAQRMLGVAQLDGVAGVGGRLLTQDRHIHAYGGLIDEQHRMRLAYHGLPEQAPGYFNRLRLTQNVGVLPLGWMMLKKSVFEALGGMRAARLSCETDFCLRALAQGYRHVLLPDCEAVETKGQRAVLDVEADTLAMLPEGRDPYYSRALEHEQGRLRYRPLSADRAVTCGLWERRE